MAHVTVSHARVIVRDYFTVESPTHADAILCAALRIERIDAMVKNGWTEQHIRDCLASTQALFERAFRPTEGSGASESSPRRGGL